MIKVSSFQKGFTMVEMLMYMGLLSLLLVVMVDLFASSLDVQLESQAVSGVDQDAKFILGRLAYDIRRADTIVLPILGSTSSGTLTLIADGSQYSYSTQSAALVYSTSNETNYLNSFETTAENVLFQRLGNNGGKNAIKITLTIKSKTERSSGQETRKIETTVVTR